MSAAAREVLALGAALALGAVLAAAAPAFAQEDAGTAYRAAVTLVLEVGETRSLGPGKVAPVRCDDPSVVEAVDQDGLALRGLHPGSTLCSVYTAASTYLSYQVQVVKPAPSPPR